MNDSWSTLTPQEKKARRLNKWLNPEINFSSSEAAQKYRQRVQRLIDAIELKKTPDRVPVILPMGFFPAYNAGTDLKDIMYNASSLKKAWDSILRDFDMDVVDSPHLVWPARAYELLDHKLYKWPGHGLSEKASSYQYVEGEYVKADEYDELLHNGFEFGQKVFLPRIFGALEPLKTLPELTPLNGLPMSYVNMFTRPEIREAYQKLITAGEIMESWSRTISESRDSIIRAGFPILRGGYIAAPFDTLGDTLRGTQGIVMDMYKRPEKILEAMEMILPYNIKVAVAAANSSQNPIVSIPLHKGEDGFMSRAQYEKFYWPTFRRMLIGMINEGIVPLIFAEGRYNTRLDIVKDLPAASTIWWFEQTDMAKAKQILGGTACIAGNVPASIMLTGTTADVKEYCRKTIEAAGKNGGLILNGAAFVHDGKAENLRAMMEAAAEYGTY